MSNPRCPACGSADIATDPDDDDLKACLGCESGWYEPHVAHLRAECERLTALLDAGAYTIKPLEWEGERHFMSAKSVMGCFAVYHWVKGGCYIWQDSNNTEHGGYDSLESGKAAAEKYYREKILTALQPTP